MADPFQMKRRQQEFSNAKPIVRDLSRSEEDLLLKPRPQKLIRAIKMLDTLTAGDEQLFEYLRSQQAEAAKRVEQAKEDMELAETPDEAAEFAPDPMDELLATPPPAVGTPDFQALKDALLKRCQKDFQDKTMELDFVAPPICLATCGIPGCCIHTFNFNGEIMHHYTPPQLVTELLKKADDVLHSEPGISHVEVLGKLSGDVMYVVKGNGMRLKIFV